MNILFVCMGNTCRSPMAEGILNAEKRPGIRAFSAGLSAYPGDPVSENAVRALRSMDIDIHTHTAQPLTRELLSRMDLIIPLTPSYAEILKTAGPEISRKIRGCLDIPDPYGGSPDVYLLCARQIAEQLDTRFPDLRINADNDLSAIAQNEAAVFPDGLSLPALQTMASDPRYRIFGLYREGQLVSYLAGASSCGEVQILTVSSLKRNRGYAKTLLTLAQEEWKKENISRLFLEVRQSNEAAIHVYRSCGFETDGVRKQLYQDPVEDGIIMHKDLTTSC